MALVWQIFRQTLDNNESLDIWKHKVSQALDQEDLLIGQANCMILRLQFKATDPRSPSSIVFIHSLHPQNSHIRGSPQEGKRAIIPLTHPSPTQPRSPTQP